jgi:hypothetical protein
VGVAAIGGTTWGRAADDGPAAARDTFRPSWDFSHGDLRVSDNKRFLVHSDGTPFFYLSDTNWQFFHRARREDAERLLEKRRQQGFTVICGAVTGALDTDIQFNTPLRVPNVYGKLPFIDQDVTRPAITQGSDPNDDAQYDYWDHVDYLVGLAESKGIYAGLIPAWYGHYRVGLVNEANARTYGRFLGERYGARPNIIWVLGGDTNVDRPLNTLRGLDEKICSGRHLTVFELDTALHLCRLRERHTRLIDSKASKCILA